MNQIRGKQPEALGFDEQSGNSGQLQGEQQAHIEELTELRRLVPSVNQRAALDAAIAALATRQPTRGGTLIGWRMIDGVRVFEVASHSGLVEPQKFVLYADYLASRQPVGQEPVAAKPLVWSEQWRGEDEDIPVWIGSSPIALPVRFGFVGLEHHNDADPIKVAESKAEAEAEYQARVMSALCVPTAPPAPAAVPVDALRDAEIVEAAKLAYGLLWMGNDLSGPELAGMARVALRDALGKPLCGEGITAARASLATHPQPAAAGGDA